MSLSSMAPALRAFIAVRIGVGAALLLAPDATLTPLAKAPVDERARWYARILGIRHLLEATVLWRLSSPRAVRLGAAVDAVHAATTLGLVADRRRRRLATINCLTACGFALAGWAVASDSGIQQRTNPKGRLIRWIASKRRLLVAEHRLRRA